jgi:cyclic pyranopterin phosphate synthase
MTTNGVLLERTAAGLKAAGLDRVNISIDSVERESYKQITGLDLLDEAVKGIDKAIVVGLKPVKINAVILKGINEDQIIPLAALARRLDVIVRFIEYFPTDKNTRPAGEYIPNSRVRKTVENCFGPLMSLVGGKSAGPAMYFKLAKSAGVIGFISGRSSMFCASCNRLRLTSDGKIRPCLYSAHSYDMKKLLRSGADDMQILETIDRIIDRKRNFTKTNSFTEEFSMRNIGG